MGRTHFLSLALASGLALSSTPAIAQDESRTLAASSPWLLDMAEDSCALRRQFSDGTHSAFMEMRQFAPDGRLRFMVYSNDMDANGTRFRYRVLPDNEDRESSSAFTITLDDGARGIMFNGSLASAATAEAMQEDAAEQTDYEYTPEMRRAREAEVTGIAFPRSFGDPVILETGSMGDPMQAMRGCMDNLLTFWGIDVEAHRDLSRQVEPIRMQRWVDRFASVYPMEALRSGEQASLNVRLIVGAGGRVEDCFVQASVGLEVFNETACQRLTRYARFEPALDAAGQPIRSYWTTSIVYAIN